MIKHSRERRKKAVLTVLRTIVFILLLYAAIKIGALGGNAFFSLDFGMVEGIDTAYFKSTLDNSIPLINTVYNSGNISVSLTNEIKSLIRKIFAFDLNSPLTILNAQAPIFQNYYIENYEQLISKNENEKNAENYANKEKQGGNESKADASSISIEEGEEKKDSSGGGTVTSGKISVFNETKYKINIDQLMNDALKFKFDKKGPKVLIYHTHTTEGYLSSLSKLNQKNVPNWSDDPSKNVVKVGEELAQNLRKNYGIEVIHNGTVHDSPSYNSSYGRSLNTINKILKSYPSIRVVLDIHRDGLGADEGKLRAVAKVNNKNAAQVMFVVGTDQIGLSHPNWKENLTLALKLQKKLNEIAPGLAKPIDLSYNRYNQHVKSGALIIEVGGDGNLMSECQESTKYLAKAINEVINKN